MIPNPKQLSALVGYILLTMLMLVVVTATISVISGDGRLFWPSLASKLVSTLAIVATLWIVSLAIPQSADIDSDFSISLFTFSNSITALAPAIHILIMSWITVGATTTLASSPIYRISERFSQHPEIFTLLVGLSLIALATVTAMLAAAQMSSGETSGTFAPSASLFALSASSFFTDQWSSTPLDLSAAAALFTIIFAPLTLMLFCRSAVHAIFVLIAISKNPRVDFYQLTSSLHDIWRYTLSFIKHFARALTIFSLSLGVFIGVFWVALESISYNNASSIALLAVDIGAQAWIQIAKARIDLILLSASVVFSMIVLGRAWNRSGFARTSHVRISTTAELIQQRLVSLLIGVAVISFSIAMIFFVVAVINGAIHKMGSTAHRASVAPEISSPAADPTLEDQVTEAEPPKQQEADHIPPLDSLIPIRVFPVCGNRHRGIEWEYGSDESLTLNLADCGLEQTEQFFFDGAILVVGLASKGTNEARENERALNRAENLARWTFSQFTTLPRAPDIYVLNLGMDSRQNSQHNEFSWRQAPPERPIEILFFNPVPDSALSDRKAAFGAISAYLSSGISISRYSRCDLFEYDPYFSEGAELKRVSNWSCPAQSNR